MITLISGFGNTKNAFITVYDLSFISKFYSATATKYRGFLSNNKFESCCELLLLLLLLKNYIQGNV